MGKKDPICTNIRSGLYAKYAKASVSEGIFTPPSGFGKQLTSESETEPSVSIGRGPRAPRLRASETPSPVDYENAPSMFGKQKFISGSSYRRSAPNTKIGTGQRGLPYKSNSILGPAYTPPTGFGKQTQSIHRSNSNTVIGTSVRFPKVKTKDTPGPSAYPAAAVAAFNKQTQSSRRSPATFKFAIGRAERDKKEKGRGKDTPGPDFIPPEGFGKQSLSTKRSEAKASIGSGPRFTKLRNAETPGPADFKPAEAFGKQSVSIRKTAQSFSFGAR